MNDLGQKICLNMIVKNEAPVIRRCLDSVLPLIDSWVIVDTGSTDGTQRIIREHLGSLPGELYERPWQDFAHNRSEALVLARGRGDYVLVIDADEVIEIAKGFRMPVLTADSYNVRVQYGGCSYLRRQLVSNALEWRYEGVVHEYITCDGARTELFLDGIQTVPHHDGARAREATTYRRDALLLEKALLEKPDDTRNVFYLAQSYRDAGDLELALRHYKRRADLGGWREEVWFSLYQVAQIRERMDAPWAEVMQDYLVAWQYSPDRAGPLFRVGMHYQAKREYHTAHMFLARAMAVPRPGPERLFVEQTLYDVQLPLEFAVSSFYVGRHADAIAVNNRLLRSSALPPLLVDQVVRNRRFSVDALFPRPAEARAAGPVHVVVRFRDPGPELDDCVESLVRQSGDGFRVVLLDEGSEEQRARVPARFRYVRTEDGDSALARYLSEEAAPDDAVFVVGASHALAGGGVLAEIRSLFDDPACMLAYGQFRSAEGEMGDAEPASSEAEFDARREGLASRSPVAFRAGLVLGARASGVIAGNPGTLFRAAGFARTRFSDAVWTAESTTLREDSCEFVDTPPAVSTKSLPRISCLMVTYDRLGLAKRAIRSFARQSYPNRELVIVTDGEERFHRALERYVASLGVDSVRFVLVDGERQTLGRLRNISMEAAGGDVVCQWDDDDLSHPERLATQAAFMLEQNAAACLLTDHLQFIEDQRILCWIDWTMGGAAKGTARLAPGTLMMLRDARDGRFRYPEHGPAARQGEDSALLESLHATLPVAHLSGVGQMYLYQYHGRNTFSREHHYRLAGFCMPTGYLNDHADKLRDAARHYPIPRPIYVVGREGPAFALS
jgi:glycosyltransferase involved in cell wall biosynthesis